MLSQADYTVIRTRRGDLFAANFLTGTLDIVDSAIVSDSNEIEPGLLDDKQVNLLLERGHLQDESEGQILTLPHLWSEYRDKACVRCYFYVQLTLACNLRCRYCFQGEGGYPQIHMTVDVLEEVLQVLESIVRRINNPSRMVVVLYGGEPLLLTNRGLIEKIFRFCEENRLRVRAISNGVNLPLFFDLLEQYHDLFEGVTITLDGDRSTHDFLRPFANGSGSYDRVVSSIGDAASMGIDVSVRLNVTPDSIGNLKRRNWRLPGVSYEIHRAEYPVYANSVRFYEILDLCLKGYVDVSEVALNQIVYFIHLFESANSYYPLFSDCFPGSVTLFSPSGSIYCCNEVNDKRTYLGHVNDDRKSCIREAEGLFSGLSGHPSDSPCLGCPAYPVCGGGCRVRHGIASNYKACDYYQDIVEMLDYYIDWKVNGAAYAYE